MNIVLLYSCIVDACSPSVPFGRIYQTQWSGAMWLVGAVFHLSIFSDPSHPLLKMDLYVSMTCGRGNLVAEMGKSSRDSGSD